MASEMVQNGVSAKTLELLNSICQVAKTVENNEFAYFTQKGFYVKENGFDDVFLYVAVLKNAKFNFEQDYVDLLTELKVNNIKTVYASANDSLSHIIKIHFEYNGYKYYLKIISDGDVEETVKFYVSLLTT